MAAAVVVATATATPNPEELFLVNQYREQIIKLALKDLYIIPVLGGGGSGSSISESQKVQDPFDRRKTITIYQDWEYKKYRRHKITVADYEKAREMSIDYENEEDEEDDDDKEDKKSDKLIELYEFLALCYLRMTPDEFLRADWGTTRPVLDACQFRTSHSPADLSQGLYEFFHLDITSHLTDLDYHLLKMYRLWTGKAKTKPWEYNGGFVYEEDLNTLLKMEELQISGENYKAKKERARAENSAGGGGGSGSSSSVGEDGVVHRRSTRFKNR